MGNIPLNLNCICPKKNDDDKHDDEIKQLKEKIQIFEYKDMPNIHNRLIELESNNQKLTELGFKMTRLEDKIDMRFEMLFLNMKIQEKKT